MLNTNHMTEEEIIAELDCRLAETLKMIQDLFDYRRILLRAIPYFLNKYEGDFYWDVLCSAGEFYLGVINPGEHIPKAGLKINLDTYSYNPDLFPRYSLGIKVSEAVFPKDETCGLDLLIQDVLQELGIEQSIDYDQDLYWTLDLYKGKGTIIETYLDDEKKQSNKSLDIVEEIKKSK